MTVSIGFMAMNHLFHFDDSLNDHTFFINEIEVLLFKKYYSL